MDTETKLKTILTLVNKQMPRTFGDGIIHVSHIDYAVKTDKPLPDHVSKKPSEVETKIGNLIAENLVEDGATLQMGIGNIPDAVLAALTNHKDLGIHSEMFAGGVIDLVKKGCVTNNKKSIQRGRIVGSFLTGPKALYDFVDDNPFIEMYHCKTAQDDGDQFLHRSRPDWASCVRFDRTRLYSGFGGQVDFIRGASEALDGKGKPIIAFSSVTKKGKSKIVPLITPDQTVFIQGAAATPVDLTKAMTEVGKKKKLKNIKVCHMHTEGPAPYCDASCEGIFRSFSFFMGGNVRKAVAEGRADALAIFLSEIPILFYRGIIKPDIALIHVSPPDKHGYCSLGTSIDCVRAAMMHSKYIIALVNKQMPRTFGDGIIHVSHIDYAVKTDKPLPDHVSKKPSEVETKIGNLIAENLVEDGATLQMGIGNIPDAVLAALTNHKDLGIHSEMFAGGVIDLVKKGCVTNNKKSIHRGRIVGSFLTGPKALYDFVDDNPFIEMLVIDYVNRTSIIARQPKMTAINSCIEVDLTGQVVSDSIGTRLYSGFGGQVDFIRGASEALDGKGKPIIAFSSVTKKGKSKIVPLITPGAGVITTRGHVHYVCTEFGVTNLFGKCHLERAYELINIAHPDHREALEKAAFKRFKKMPQKKS